jgi:DNA-binding cell septation regulator SpoVG
MRRFFGSLLVVLLMGTAALVYAEGEIYVTSVKKLGGKTAIVLNDCIEVRDIVVAKTDGEVTIGYPVYVSGKGKEYPQFEVINEQAKAEIEKAVTSGKPSDKSSKTLTFKVSKFSKMKRQSTLKAFASVDFNGAVRVECKVMDGKKGLWVAWPSAKDQKSGKYQKQVLILNSNVKNVVEKSLLKKYAEPAAGEEKADDTSVQEEQ